VSQVNLLPPELRQRQATRRSTSLAIAGGLVLVALVVGFSFLRASELSQKQEDLAAQRDVNARVQQQIAEIVEGGNEGGNRHR
jgi:Tfp pilus assembly protein PilN